MLSWKLIFNFYLTLLIPLLYLLGLILVVKFPSTTSFLPQNSICLFVYLFICSLGLLLWLLSYLTLGLNLTVLPKAKKLITSGPYRFFRHPIYLGITLTLFGLSLTFASLPGLVYTIIIVIPLNLYRAKKEEEVLLQKFPHQYQEYQKKTLF